MVEALKKGKKVDDFLIKRPPVIDYTGQSITD
jgi:hypothetical protein